MGTDPIHLTEQAYGKMADSIFLMVEGKDTVLSSGKREVEKDDDRPSPTIMGRKAWVYENTSCQGRRGSQGGQGERGAPHGGMVSW